MKKKKITNTFSDSRYKFKIQFQYYFINIFLPSSVGIYKIISNGSFIVYTIEYF